MNVLGHKTGYLRRRVPDDVQQRNDVWATGKVLENLDFTFDFFLLDGFKDFDNALLLIDNIDALEHLPRARRASVLESAIWSMGGDTHLRVLSPPHLAHNLVVVLAAPLDLQIVYKAGLKLRRT